MVFREISLREGDFHTMAVPHTWPACWNTAANKPQGNCPSRLAWSVHGTEAGPAEEDKDRLQRRLCSIRCSMCLCVGMNISGLRPNEIKSEDIQGTVRETPRIIHGCPSEGASNLTGGGRVCQTQKINIKHIEKTKCVLN